MPLSKSRKLNFLYIIMTYFLCILFLRYIEMVYLVFYHQKYYRLRRSPLILYVCALLIFSVTIFYPGFAPGPGSNLKKVLFRYPTLRNLIDLKMYRDCSIPLTPRRALKVQCLKLHAWKFGNRGLKPHSGLIFEETKCFLPAHS